MGVKANKQRSNTGPGDSGRPKWSGPRTKQRSFQHAEPKELTLPPAQGKLVLSRSQEVLAAREWWHSVLLEVVRASEWGLLSVIHFFSVPVQ